MKTLLSASTSFSGLTFLGSKLSFAALSCIILSLMACSPNAADHQNEIADQKENTMSTISIQSSNDFASTEAKLIEAIEEKDLKLFTIIDHGKGARSIDADIGESKLFIFGNPKAGTPLMVENNQMGLELPLKILITSKAGEAPQISYTDLAITVKNYDIAGKDELIEKIAGNLSGLANAAAKP